MVQGATYRGLMLLEEKQSNLLTVIFLPKRSPILNPVESIVPITSISRVFRTSPEGNIRIGMIWIGHSQPILYTNIYNPT